MNYQENVQYQSLKNKVVAITGGASGIGEELVRAYVNQGAKVAFMDFNREAGETLALELGCLFLSATSPTSNNSNPALYKLQGKLAMSIFSSITRAVTITTKSTI